MQKEYTRQTLAEPSAIIMCPALSDVENKRRRRKTTQIEIFTNEDGAENAAEWGATGEGAQLQLYK